MAVRTLQPEFDVIATGFESVEGPTIHPDGHLYFTNPNGGGIHRMAPEGGPVELVVPKRKGVGGIAAHVDGGIVISGRDLSRVVDGTSTTLVAREDVPTPEGLRVGGFNDIHADRWGRLLAGAHLRDADDRHHSSCLVVLEPGGRPQVAYGDVRFTNGIAQSPDGTTLYHADTQGGVVLVADIAEDRLPSVRGAIDAHHLAGHPDGLACDADGLVWLALSGGSGVARFRPDGTLDTFLELPMPKVLSVCFFGEDVEGLWLTTMDDAEGSMPGETDAAPDRMKTGSVLRLDLPYKGGPVGLARV
jgi:gluconolactonase